MRQEFNIISKAFLEIFNVFREIVLPSEDKTYNATFTPPREIFKKGHKGFSLGANQSLSIPMSFRHLLVTAPTSGGKSSKVCIPSAINLHGQGSIIINDCNRELYPRLGHIYKDTPTYIVDFSDKNCERTAAWNPLPKDVADLPNFMTRISDFMHRGAHEKFWTISSAEILTSLGEVLYKFEEKYRTPANILMLLNMLMGKENVINKFMAKYADQSTWLEFLAFSKNSDNVKKSILSSAKATLSVFRQPHIQKITSYSTFNIEDIRKLPVAIFLQTSPADLDKYSLLIAEFFNQVIGHLLSQLPREKEDKPVFLIIDEAGVIKIDMLSVGAVQLRKFFCGCIICCQSAEQLTNLYGKEQASTIIANCSRLIMTNAPLSTAKEVSVLAGKTEFTDSKGVNRIRELITVDEVRSMDEDEAILIAGHYRPFKIRMQPYFEDRYMHQITSEEPPSITSNIPSGPIPILDIEELIK